MVVSKQLLCVKCEVKVVKMALKRIASVVHFGALLTVCLLLLTGCVGMIHTDQQAIGWVGENIRLPCDFSYQDVLALYWTNSSGNSKANFFKQQRISFDDRFALNEDFSLFITDIKVLDEGRYECRLELDSGRSFINHTELTIYAAPSMPRIEQCLQKPKGNGVHRFCTVETSNTHPFNLDCRVTGFRPNVTLEWTSSGIVKQPIGKPFQRTLHDGTSEREVTISVTAKLNEEQNYTCTVRGEATSGTDWSTTVTVLVPPMPTEPVPPEKGLSVGGQVALAIILPLLFICIALCIILGIMVALRRNEKLPPLGGAVLDRIPFLKTLYLPKKDPEEEKLQEEQHRKLERREKLRDEIRDYKPGKFVSSNLHVSKVNIGLFGQMAAGKSSLINSLYYALQGTYQIITEEGASFGNSKTKQRLSHPITPYINIFDNRGMKDYSDANMDDILAQIRGERGLDPSQPIQLDKENQIHCAIFVYQNKEFGRVQAFGFITKFFRDAGMYHHRGPMFVVTHKEDVKDLDGLIESLKTCDVTEDKVVCWENYTSTKHDEDIEKDIKMLEFLKTALQAGDWNIYHQERKEREDSNNPRCAVM